MFCKDVNPPKYGFFNFAQNFIQLSPTVFKDDKPLKFGDSKLLHSDIQA